MTYDHDKMKESAKTLEAAVLDILQHHVGAASAIKAGDIAHRLGLQGRYADRPVREVIKTLRRQGHLVISSVKPPRGYYLAANEAEWLAFRDTNLKPRALDILETASAMGHAAQQRWGAIYQLDLELTS